MAGHAVAQWKAVVLGLVCAALVLMPSAVAQTVVPVSGPVSETVTIPASEWRAYRVGFASGDSFEFSVRVSQGGNIDVYVMPAAGYSEYTDPTATSFTYLVAGSREITQSFGTSVSPGSGTYYLVVDNINVSASGASATAPVTVDVSAQLRPFPIVGVVIGVVVVVAIIVAVILLIRSRRKKRAMMPSVGPPGQPPMQPPQGPPPGG